MPGPPPPPPPNLPGPPPPPVANFNNVKKSSGSSSGGGDMRNALLSQIQQGTKLKKVNTVDKSGPAVAGRVAGDNSKSSSPTKTSASTRGPMMKNSPPDSATSSPIRQGGFSNLTDELQYKLTIKKNKNSPLKEAKTIPDTKESSPPSTTSTTSSKSFINEIKSKQQSVISPQHLPTSSVSSLHPVSDAIPNKSSLFNKNINSNSNNNVNNNNNSNNSSYENKSQPSAPKIINHGKPNLAPKPPPQLSLAMNNNNNVSNVVNNGSSLNDGSRKSVGRVQSMKSPRSPPIGIAPSPGPINSDNHFGTMRNPSSQTKTQEALNLSVVPKSVAQRPTNRPPPPPVPSRNIATNLTSQPHAKSTTALNNTHIDQNLNAPVKRIPSSGSSSNISNIERNNVDTIDSVVPPLPPHRISSAHKKPQQQQPSIINSQDAPIVPKRHSSMSQNVRPQIDNGGNSKLFVDLEARYSLMFHSVSEFPPPKQFLNLDKSYPSKAVMRPANGF